MKEDRVEREGSEELWVGVPLILEISLRPRAFLSLKYVYVDVCLCVFTYRCINVCAFACVYCACTYYCPREKQASSLSKLERLRTCMLHYCTLIHSPECPRMMLLQLLVNARVLEVH